MSHTVQSEELFKLYRELEATGVTPEARTEELADESRYAASQWRLMWRKFIRNRAALVGGVVIFMFYLTALFGNFVAPYTLSTRFRTRIYMPPQRVYFFDEGSLHPFVYDMKLTIEPNTLRKIYEPDPTKKYPTGKSTENQI